MIELSCPGCGHHLRIPNKFMGAEGKCKYCGEHFTVPSDFVETPSDLDSSVPGSGRHEGGGAIGVPGLSVDDSGTFSFEDVMAKGAGAAPTAAMGMSPEDAGHLADPMGLDAPRAGDMRVREYEEPLGCLFWGTVFFFPPVGLVWAMVSPSDHSERGKGIVASVLMMLVAVGTLALSFFLVSNFQYDVNDGLATADAGYDDAGFDSADGGGVVDFFTPRRTATVIMEGIPVPAVRDIRFMPTSPTPLTEGPFASMDTRNLRYYLAVADDGVEYLTLQAEYQTALNDAGWEYEFVAGFDGNVGMYTDMYGYAQGNQVHLRIVENDLGIIVHFITRPDQ